MLPAVLARFLERASVAIAATRDRDLAPTVHWVSSWRLEEDGTTVRCGIGSGYTEGLLDALRENGRFALTAEVIGPHETYQFKGRFVDSSAVDAQDLALHGECRGRYVADVMRQYPGRFSQEALERSVAPPAVVVRFRVDEVFVQTPGPAAGMRLFPRED